MEKSLENPLILLVFHITDRVSHRNLWDLKGGMGKSYGKVRVVNPAEFSRKRKNFLPEKTPRRGGRRQGEEKKFIKFFTEFSEKSCNPRSVMV